MHNRITALIILPKIWAISRLWMKAMGTMGSLWIQGKGVTSDTGTMAVHP